MKTVIIKGLTAKKKPRLYFCPCAHLGKFESLILQLRNGNCTHFQDVEPIFFQICYNIITLLSRRGTLSTTIVFFLFDWISHRDIDLFSFCLILVLKRKYHVICSNCKNYLPQTECLLALKLITSVALYHFVVIDNNCWLKLCSWFIISGWRKKMSESK